MHIVFDLIALVTIIVFIIVCWYKGFLSAFLGAVKWIVAFVAASLLSGLLAGVFYNAVLEEKNIKAVERVVPADSTLLYDATELNGVLEKLGYYIPTQETQELTWNIKEAQEKNQTPAQAVCLYIIKPLQMNIIKPIFFTIIFILVILIGFIMQKVFKHTNKIPVVGTVNRVSGAILGLVFGIVAVAFGCCILALIANLTHDNIPWLNSTILEKTAIRHLINFSLYRKM